jgi:hypothetical protein
LEYNVTVLKPHLPEVKFKGGSQYFASEFFASELFASEYNVTPSGMSVP